jgi:Uma2 family endonuclease
MAGGKMSIVLTKPKSEPRSEAQTIPPLQMGDRLTRAEFERRYKASPHIKKAELIDGIVYMPTPTHHTYTGLPHFDLVGWLWVYRASTPGIKGCDNATLRIDGDSIVEPAAILQFTNRSHAPLPQIPGKDTPELLVEIAASTASYDMNQKKHVYARNGVPEYLVYLAYEKRIVWFVLREGVYEELAPDEKGILRSEIFPGLWLNAPALLNGDMAAVLATVQAGIASDEHTRFREEIGRVGD